MNRLATLTLLGALALLPLGGCMCHRGLSQVSPAEMEEIHAAAQKPAVIVLVGGHAIEDATILGWTHIGTAPALAVETEEEGHILIKQDQISLIVFPNEKPDDKHPAATEPKKP